MEDNKPTEKTTVEEMKTVPVKSETTTKKVVVPRKPAVKSPIDKPENITEATPAELLVSEIDLDSEISEESTTKLDKKILKKLKKIRNKIKEKKIKEKEKEKKAKKKKKEKAKKEKAKKKLKEKKAKNKASEKKKKAKRKSKKK